MFGGYYFGGLYFGQTYPVVTYAATGSVSASFAGSSAPLSVTAFANATISATFSATFSPEGLGSGGVVVATFVGSSSGVARLIATSSAITANFSGSSASGQPTVHLYSTQRGNQFVTDITSYGLHANVRVYVTVGVPTVNLGNDGDFALRRDTTNGSGTQMYHRASGSWTAVA